MATSRTSSSKYRIPTCVCVEHVRDVRSEANASSSFGSSLSTVRGSWRASAAGAGALTAARIAPAAARGSERPTTRSKPAR